MRHFKTYILAAIAILTVAAALGASNKKKKETKCESAEVEECTSHVNPSADGAYGEAGCDNFRFTISNVTDAAEYTHRVLRWSGDGDCPDDQVLDEDVSYITPVVTWAASVGDDSYSGSGNVAELDPGNSGTASCIFTLEAVAPKCNATLVETYSATARFENNVTLSGGGDICTSSTPHESHKASYTVECGDVISITGNGVSPAQQSGHDIWVTGSSPQMGATLKVKARGGEATTRFNVLDAGDLKLYGCGCFSDSGGAFETMGERTIRAVQELVPSGRGAVKIEGTTVKGWFDCNGNGNPDDGGTVKTRNFTIAELGELEISYSEDACGKKEETFNSGSKIEFRNTGVLPEGRSHTLEIVDVESNEEGMVVDVNDFTLQSAGQNAWTMEIPCGCPAATVYFELKDPSHACKTLKRQITISGCACNTCEEAGSRKLKNGSVDITLGLGRTETGGLKSPLKIKLDDPSIMPEVESCTFPDGRMDSFETNGVLYLSFYRKNETEAFASYELTPGETAFTSLEYRDGTPRSFARWTKTGEEWDMEIFDAAVSPMELVERVVKTRTATSGGMIVQESDGALAKETEYRILSNGDRFAVRETLGTGENARTTYNAPNESGGGFVQIRSTVNPDGSWILYTYDSKGRVLTETEPFGDAAPILDSNHAVTGYNGKAKVTEYIYSPVDPRDDGTLLPYTPRTTLTRIGSDSLGWTETSRNYHAEFLVTDGGAETQRVAIAEREATANAAYGAIDALRTTTWYNWRNENAGRPIKRIAEDGLVTFWSYELTATNRVTESFTTTQSATNGIPWKTTISCNIANLKGDVQREETWLVVDNDERELLFWTDYERDSAGRILRSESSNGDIYEAQWGCCGEDWTLDERGILTDYTYDATKRRVSSSCGTVTTLYAYDLSGNATNVTRYGISGTSPALVASSSSGFDDAGRIAWTIGENGIRTEYLYGISPEGGEIRTTIQGAGTDSAVTNTTVSYRDGATKATYLNGILKTAEIREPLVTTIYEGTNGVSSARWSRTTTDFLGRVVAEERPGFGGFTLVTSNLYDNCSRLISSSTHSTCSTCSTWLKSTLYLYNDLGERIATVDDRNFDGIIDWTGPDLVSSNDTCYVAIDDTLWRETKSYSVHDDNSSEAQLMGVGRTRMTGLGEDGLASESVSIDQRGNATTNRVWRYRDDAMEISETKYPTSQIAALSVVSNNIAIMSVSQTGVTNTLSYDALNRQISQTDGRGNTTQTIYDEHGRVASIIDALGYATTYGYDALGRQTSVTDPLTNTVTTTYDAEGRVIAQRGATYPVDYAYNEFGEKVAMTTYRDLNSSGDTTRWLLDEATGLVTNKVYADGLGPSYTYTPDGKLASRIWARGIVTTYSYDANGSLTNTVYSDSTPTISLSYDRAGRQIEAHDAAGVTTFTYNEYGSTTNETVIGVAGTNVLERYWDEYGRALGYSLNGTRQSTISYEEVGRISSMLADGSDTPFTWSYLSGSDLKSSLAYPNGLTASWQYDANGQLLQVRNAFPTNIISQYDYTYDAAGRRTERYHSGSAFATPDQIYYDYNERSELTNAVASVDASYNFAYNYDDIGNRLWSVENTNETAYTANNLNQYTAIEEAADTFVPQFDADGNQTLIKTKTGIWQATYNGENRPVYWSNGITNIVMSFDRMGRRVQYLETTGLSTSASNTFTYDNYLCIARNREQDNGTIETDRFIWDLTEPVATRPLVFNYATAPPAYYTHDGNKNVSELVDGNEAIVAHYEYEVFGAVCVKNGTSTDENPWGFSSEYNDDVLRLVYYNYRHYEPAEGRWTKRDNIEEQGGNNLYGFCNNNAIALYDINGEAYFAVRSLKGVSTMMQGDKFFWGDRKNVEVLHEHLFFQDGKLPSNIGFGDEGIFFEDSFSGYRQTSGGYDDCIMRLAVARVSTPLYSLVGNLFLGFGNKYNCQDYAQELRAKYQELRNDKEILCKCKKRR